jgi:hypothetical protein
MRTKLSRDYLNILRTTLPPLNPLLIKEGKRHIIKQQILVYVFLKFPPLIKGVAERSEAGGIGEGHNNEISVMLI